MARHEGASVIDLTEVAKMEVMRQAQQILPVDAEGRVRVAYLTTAYPKVSHTFIRREILELERRGYDVMRVAIRPVEDDLPDEQDRAEAAKTVSILGHGPVRLLLAAARTALTAPWAFLGSVREALGLSRASERGLIRHLAYLAEACWLRGVVRREGVRHVHVHFGTNAAAVAMLLKRLGGPAYSMTVHGPDEFDAAIGFSLGKKIRESSFTVAISDYGAAQLRRWVPHTEWDKIHVVRCGVDGAMAGPIDPIPATSRTFVCVGRLSPQKGHFVLIEAMAKLMRRGSDAKLVLVGDGELRREIEAQIRARDLGRAVEITGWASGEEVRRHLRNCRALVLPSFAEGLPVVIMEAFAMARPVISTYVAAIPELVRPGENGWLVPAGNAEALSVAMQEALDTPVERLNAMGRAGARIVAQRHNPHIEIAKLAEHLADAMGLSAPEPQQPPSQSHVTSNAG